MPHPTKAIAVLLALLGLPTGLAAAPKIPPSARKAVAKGPIKTKPRAKPALKGKLIRIIPARVTVFYSFKDKKTGNLHPMASVSKSLTVKVVKPTGKAVKGKVKKVRARLDKKRLKR